MTVEKRESISTWRLTTTKTRDFLGSLVDERVTR